MTLSERDQAVIWHPFTQAQTASAPIAILRAEGIWLYAEDGKRYLDGTSSWWVNAHGHAHPYIADQIADQASKLEHIIFAGFTHEPAVLLAEKLIAMLPGEQTRIFYSDNGSTSVEVALKMALQYHFNRGEERRKIIAFSNAYHGDTFGAMSVGARNAFSAPFSPLLFDVLVIDPPEEGNEQTSLEQLCSLLENEKPAAFIFEPLVQGANGMRMHDAETLSKQIAICRSHGILTIADEVFTGFYRTGKCFSSDYLTEKPDLMCLSKTLTGGTLPLGVTAAPEFIYEAFLSNDKFKTFFHGHSFTANPIACRSALASLELLEKPECLSNIRWIVESHRRFVTELQEHPAISEIRHLGTILAIELKTSEERGYMNPLSEQLTAFFLERHIYLRPLGNVIYCTPPYVISKEEIGLIYQAIRECLDELVVALDNSHK
jgi:adenosylmethionine-8-amino-7-oxononanoate aminotransferase